MFSQLRTKEWGLGELLSGGWEIFKKHWVDILLITLLTQFPANVVIAVFAPKIEPGQPLPPGFWNYILVVLALSLTVGLLGGMAVIAIVDRETNQESIKFDRALKGVLSRLGAAIITILWGSFIIFGLYLLSAIPTMVLVFFAIIFFYRNAIFIALILGVFAFLLALVSIGILITFFIFYSFALYAAVLRDRWGGEALAYSRSLVRGQWWKVVGVTLVIGLSFGLIANALGRVLTPLGLIGQIILSTIISFISYFSVVTYTLFFLNLDYRKNLATDRVSM